MGINDFALGCNIDTAIGKKSCGNFMGYDTGGKMNEDINLPLETGDILKLGVTRFGKNGDPILIHKGFIIFLKDIEKKGIQLNTVLEIKITKVLPSFAFALRTNGK